MGTIIRVSGQTQQVDFTGVALSYLQNLVGGYIQQIRLDENQWMIINEEGKLENLPKNPVATKMADHCLLPRDYIAGTALILGVDEINW